MTEKHLRHVQKIDAALERYFIQDGSAWNQSGDHALTGLGQMAAAGKPSGLGFGAYIVKETRPTKHSRPIAFSHSGRRISALMDRLRRKYPGRAAALHAHYTERDGEAAAKSLGITRNAFYLRKFKGIVQICRWWDER